MVPKKVVIEKADRLYQLPPELNAYLPERRRRSLIRKMAVIDLATFNWPALPDPALKVPASQCTAADPAAVAALREQVASWYFQQFSVRLNPDKEVFIGGSLSNLIYSLTLAFADRGDVVLVPEIGIPLYRRAVISCGADPVVYSMSGKHDWLPDFSRINTRLSKVARLLFLNTPHNPTGAELSASQITELVELASVHNVVVINDTAYMTLAARTPVSLMSVPGGKKIGVEVGSFSYLFGLPRLPIGFVVGNRDVISGLRQAGRIVPTFLSAYAVQSATAAVQQFPNEFLRNYRQRVSASRAVATNLLELLDLEPSGLDTVPFVWGRIERRRSAATVASLLYRRGRILALPGTAFGDSAEGFLRFSLTAGAEQYAIAVDSVRRRPRIFQLTRER